MAKLITFFMFMFIGAAVLSGIMAGGGGIATTQLSAAVSATATTLPVDDTEGFLTSDYVIIGSETIFYTGTTPTSFTGCTRGYKDTSPDTHTIDSLVMTRESSTVNNALGFNAMAEADKSGAGAIITVPLSFITKTLPNIIGINIGFLDGDLSIVAYFFFAMATGLVIVLVIAALQAIF